MRRLPLLFPGIAFFFVVSACADHPTTPQSSDQQTIVPVVASEISGESTNLPPVADPGGPYFGYEGSPITLDGTGSYDPDGSPIVSYEWDLDEDGQFDDATGPTITHTWLDDFHGSVCLRVSDGLLSDQACTSIPFGPEVRNVAPVCGPVSVPSGPVPLGDPVVLTASFTDVGIQDTHTAVWYWSSPPDPLIYTPGVVNQGAGSGTVDGTTVFTAPGTYSGGVSITDDNGGNCTMGFDYVIVYESSGGFVTGGGWIDSPPGAYTPDANLTGKASFGFVSKEKKNAPDPQGNTEFQLRAAGLHFHSSAYDWLMVTGNEVAVFKGTGTVNRDMCVSGDPFNFQIWAKDGSPDTFRIKIWCEEGDSESVLYDNGMDQALSGGSIEIHTNGR